MGQDVFKILKDLEYKAVGVDPHTQKMATGYFVSFRNIGLPIPEEDFSNPWSPMGAEMKKIQSDAKAASTPPGAGSQPDGAGTVQPPAPIDMNALLSAGIGKSMMNYVNTFYLSNEKLNMSPDYSVMPAAGHVDDAWFAIVNGANVIPPKGEISDDIKHALEHAKTQLMTADGDPTPHYSKYNEYRDAYNSKVKTLNRNFADALSNPNDLRMWPITGKLYQDDVNKAWMDWQAFGFKPEIETAMNILAGQGQDPALLLINRAKQKWENSLVHFDKIGDIPYTFMLPRKWYSADEGDGWMTYSQEDFHTEAHMNESSSSFTAHAGLNLGFFSVGASASGSQKATDMKVKTSNLGISFSYCCVDIIRPWLDTNLLNLRNWFLVGNYTKNCISDGTLGQMLKQTSEKSTFLPSVVTSLILIKNLKIKWAEASSQKSTFESAISGGGSVGYGPFTVGGSYSHGKKKADFESNFNSQGLSCPGVQLVGYVSTIMPASPPFDSSVGMKK